MIRENCNWVSKIIWIGLVLFFFSLRLVQKTHSILSTNQNYNWNQSWRGHLCFCCASDSLHVFVSSSHWLRAVTLVFASWQSIEVRSYGREVNFSLKSRLLLNSLLYHIAKAVIFPQNILSYGSWIMIEKCVIQDQKSSIKTQVVTNSLRTNKLLLLTQW